MEDYKFYPSPPSPPTGAAPVAPTGAAPVAPTAVALGAGADAYGFVHRKQAAAASAPAPAVLSGATATAPVFSSAPPRDGAGRRTPSTTLGSSEPWPLTPEQLVVAEMVLYGQRSRPRLPVFEAICPSDE